MALITFCIFFLFFFLFCFFLCVFAMTHIPNSLPWNHLYFYFPNKIINRDNKLYVLCVHGFTNRTQWQYNNVTRFTTSTTATSNNSHQRQQPPATTATTANSNNINYSNNNNKSHVKISTVQFSREKAFRLTLYGTIRQIIHYWHYSLSNPCFKQLFFSCP